MTPLGQGLELRHDFPATAGIQRASWFIRQHDTAAVHQRPGNRDALLLATGKFPRPVPQTMCQTESRKQISGPGQTVVLGCPGIDSRHLDVFAGRGHA